VVSLSAADRPLTAGVVLHPSPAPFGRRPRSLPLSVCLGGDAGALGLAERTAAAAAAAAAAAGAVWRGLLVRSRRRELVSA